jgi:4-hydroxy-tetrahydrodipicolinate synthase
MLKTTTRLEGVIPALITPLSEHGKIDFPLLEKQVSYLSSAGVQGFFVNGTTAEGPYLTTVEKLEVFRSVKAVTQGQQFLCLACIQPSTAQVLEEMWAFQTPEPDFIVAVTPYYYAVSQEVIVQHYKEIARHSPAPVILYTIPACTHNPLTLESILELSLVENIVGVKDSSGDFIPFMRGVYTELSRDFAWIQGEDYLDGPSLLIGAKGIVTGLGNVWIDPYLDVYRAAKQGDTTGVHNAQKRINALYQILRINGSQNISAIKAGAALLGRSTSWMKIPALTLPEEYRAKVKAVLGELGLL